MNIELLIKVAGISRDVAHKWAEHLIPEMQRFEINNPMRQAYFLSQMAHESQGFTKLVENFNYTDPERIARVFKSPFDLNGDAKVDPEEIEFAKRYVRKPEALANRAYANRMGNGNERSGDGWRYRGRGLTHLTGKANYKAAGDALNWNLLQGPSQAEMPIVASQIACWFWQRNGLNQQADRDALTEITKRINGGTNGMDDRRRRLRVAKLALGLKVPQ